MPGGERRGGEVDLFLDPTAAPDISPRALRTWSEDDLVAALVQGRDRDGRPFHQRWMLGNFADLATADAIAVARYLLADASSEIPARSSGGATGAARGAYLVSLGRCELCHGEDLGGGSAVAVPGGESLPAANISLDVETGVGRLSREEFIDYFKSLSGPEFQRVEVPPDTPNTAMPWPQFSQMTRDDLGSIYDHLATRAPVRRPVPAP